MVDVIVELDKEQKTQKQIFEFVCKKATSLNVINKGKEKNVVEAFQRRESEFSTALGDGFAIPHAVSSEIKKVSIFFVRNKTNIKWDDVNKDVKYMIFLLIPEKDRNSQHMDILSKIATSLLDDNFKKILKTSKSKKAIHDEFVKLQSDEEQVKSSSSSYSGKLILGITACPVGIAHTYLAAEKLKEAAERKGFKCKVETHGSVGVKNEFSKKDIEEAEMIIIASDIGIDTSRFNGKKLYQTKVKKAVDDSDKVIELALKEASIQNKSSNSTSNQTKFDDKKEGKVIKHLMTGVSYMIPFIIFGGLLIALSLGLQKMIYPDAAGNASPGGSFLWYMEKFGVAAFGLMVPILGGFIANSIAGRSAIAPAMIVSFIANDVNCIYPLPGIDNVQTPMGFIGAILFGLIIGHTVKWMNTWRIHKNISALMPVFIIPLGVTLFYSLIATFIIGSPIAFVMDKFGEAMRTLFEDTNNINIGAKVGIGIGMGLVIGAMAGFDMGGPINKIAFITSSALLTLDPPITNPMGMMAAAIPVAPIGMGIATIIYKNHFDEQQKSMGVSAIIMGSIGISEGAIPFAVADPKRVFISNIVGSAVAGAIAGALGVTCAVSHGGPIVAILTAVSGNFIGNTVGVQMGLGITFFFVAIIIGSLVTAFMYGLMLKLVKDKNVIEEEKINKSSNGRFTFISEKTKNLGMFVWIKNNKKLFAFIILTTISAILLIVGTTLTAIDGHNIGNAINGATKVPNADTVNPDDTIAIWPGNGNFPIMGIYGLFGLVSGFITSLFTVFYGFTVFHREKEINA